MALDFSSTLPTPASPRLEPLQKLLGIGAYEVAAGGETNYGQNVTDSLIGGILMGGVGGIMEGFPDISDVLVKLTQYLLTAPLEALQILKYIIPGTVDDDFIDAVSAVATILNQFVAGPLLASVEFVGNILDLITAILSGGDVAGKLEDLVGSIPVVGPFLEGIVAVFSDLIGLLGGPVLGGGNIQEIISNLEDIPILGSVIALIRQVVETVLNALSHGFDPVSVLDDLIGMVQSALQNIPFLNVLGVGGPANIGSALQDTWDQLVGGLVGLLGGNAGLPDLFNVAQEISSRASLGQFSWDVLAIRNNKGFTSGMLPTSTSAVNFSKVALAPAAPTFAVTQSTAITGFQRIEEGAPMQVVSWLGEGLEDITHFFVNIWQVDQDTGDLDRVYASSNIIGDLESGMSYQFHELPDPIGVEPGEVYGMELSLRGTGTHNVVGESSWVPEHPTVFPRKMSAVRDSGTSSPPSSISEASIVYGTDVPFIELAIDTGNTEVTHPNETVTSNSGESSRPVPNWANYIDVIAVGGGGGGFVGVVLGTGGGGYAGEWATTTWSRGTHFTGTPTIEWTVGVGGDGGEPLGDQTGDAGTASVVSIPSHTCTADGGAGNSSLGSRNGRSPGNQVYRGKTYVGGSVQSSGSMPGSPPGGAGSGGNQIYPFSPGGGGANGQIWIVFRVA